MFLYLSLYVGAAPEVVEKPGDTSLSRLKVLYTHAKELSESEVTYVHSTAFMILISSTLKKKITETCFAPYIILSIVLGCSISSMLLNQLDHLVPSGPPGQLRRRLGLC